MVNCIYLIIAMSPRFVLGWENVRCVAEVVDRSLKADCTDFTDFTSNAVKYSIKSQTLQKKNTRAADSLVSGLCNKSHLSYKYTKIHTYSI